MDFVLESLCCLSSRCGPQIDYGETYERERVRKGYPIVSGDELQQHQDSFANDDDDFLAAIKEYSANEIAESIDYLDKVKGNHIEHSGSSIEFRARFCFVSLAIAERIDAILEDFKGLDLRSSDLCLNGFDETFKTKVIGRFIRVFQWALFNHWKDDASFRGAIGKTSLLKEKLSVFMQSSWRSMHTGRELLLQTISAKLVPSN